MAMQIGDLGKAWVLWVDAAGCVTIHAKGHGNAGSLPVFSSDSMTSAESIRVRHCRLARDGSGNYFLNERPKGVEDLGKVSDLFRATAECVSGPAPMTPEARRAALAILDKIEAQGD